jgi:soluble cytochrome b562
MSTSTNTLRSVTELKDLLSQLDHVKTSRTFKRWKSSFLTRWQEFLDQAHCQKAQDAYTDFALSMEKFIKMLESVNAFVQNGDMTPQGTSVKARHCLNETSKVLSRVIGEKDALIPQKAKEEKERGYNKFHMGAVLVRDNFGEYGRLCEAREILQHMRTKSLNEVADKQQLEEMDNFSNTLQKFW